MEDNKLGVEMSADTPSSTGVEGDAAVSTSLPDEPILPENTINISYLLKTRIFKTQAYRHKIAYFNNFVTLT